MKKYVKWIGVVLFVALVGGLVARGLDRRSQAADAGGQMTRVAVTRGDIETRVEASGQVVPLAQATLALDVPGTVAQVLVKEGQWVQSGDPLLRLEDAALERAVRSAEQSLSIQQANLAGLQKGASAKEIAAAEAAVDSAQAQLEQLIAGPRQQEVAAAQANVAAAQAALWAASAQFDQVTAGASEAEVSSARAQVASALAQQKVARDTHDATLKCQTVKSPTGEDKEICPALGTREEQARYNLHAADEALAAAQAQLDQLLGGATEEQVDAAQANVAAAGAQRDAAQAQYDLLLAGSTEAQVAAAQAQLAQARASLATLIDGASEEQLAVAEAQVAQARIALEEARDNLAQATLHAPFEGMIARLLIEPGEWTLAGNPVVILTDLSAVEVELAVDEVDIGQVSVGQPATVTLETWPDKELTATVSRIAPTADVQTGIVTYRVYLSLDEAGGATDFATLSSGSDEALVIRPGMTANAEIVTRRLQDVLLVPNQAIQADRAAGRYTVERASGNGSDEDKSQVVEIAVGLRDVTHAQVLEGLTEGDVVLIRSVKSQAGQGLSLPGARRLFGE